MHLYSHPLSNKSNKDVEKTGVLEEKSETASENDSQFQGSQPLQDMPLSSGAITSPPKEDVNITDWNGPDDPDNPHNWGSWQRIYHATIPALFGFAV